MSDTADVEVPVLDNRPSNLVRTMGPQADRPVPQVIVTDEPRRVPEVIIEPTPRQEKGEPKR